MTNNAPASISIDIGNTRTKAAIFTGDKLVHREVWEKPSLPELERLAYNHRVAQAILSSSANVPEALEAFLKKNCFYLRLDAQTPLPIALRYSTPQTLGKDRIAAAAGAFHLFPGENCLVVDAGTCITTDLLNAAGEFLGGNIAPGVEMRLRAMHEFTANLPLVPFSGAVAFRSEPPSDLKGGVPEPFSGSPTFRSEPQGFLGDSTENAIRNGGGLHAVLEMQAFISLCRRHFRPLRVVLTGGDADFFAKNLKTRIFARPNLVLTGLHKILQHNVQLLEKRSQSFFTVK